MATMPAIAPETIPRELGLPWCQLANIHARAPAAAAVFVVTKAIAALLFTARALPALNPNQPTQRSAAPIRATGILCGSMECSPKPARFPITRARASAAKPEQISTTVPSGKIDEAHLCCPATTPSPVCKRAIDNGEPYDDEHNE